MQCILTPALFCYSISTGYASNLFVHFVMKRDGVEVRCGNILETKDTATLDDFALVGAVCGAGNALISKGSFVGAHGWTRYVGESPARWACGTWSGELYFRWRVLDSGNEPDSRRPPKMRSNCWVP